MTAIERLEKLCDECGLKAEDLDELIYELHDGAAAQICNDGLQAQLKYLLKTCGPLYAEGHLQEILDNLSDNAEEEVP